MESNLQPTEIIVFAGIGILIMVALALVMVSYANRAQRRIMTQRMQAQATELRHQQDLLQRNMIVQEEERQRIAAQLHDDIGSKLGVLHLTFHRLRRTEAQSDQYGPMCEEITGLIATTLDTTRRISHELMPPTLEDFGLLEALQEFCEGIRKTGAVDIRLEHAIARTDLRNAATELNLFRIVQELTSNTLKYANARLITVQVHKNEGKVQLRYCDDGQGFDLENTRSKGLGLKNLENRARIIAGEWQINTSPGHGFEALISF